MNFLVIIVLIALVSTASALDRCKSVMSSNKNNIKDIKFDCVVNMTAIFDPGEISYWHVRKNKTKDPNLKNVELIISVLYDVCLLHAEYNALILFNAIAKISSQTENASDATLCFQHQLAKIKRTSSLLVGYNRQLMTMSDEECDQLVNNSHLLHSFVAENVNFLTSACIEAFPEKIKYGLLILATSKKSDSAVKKLKMEYLNFFYKTQDFCSTTKSQMCNT
jgi:hypothetical protein